jgi:hypothetical protein
MSYHTRILQRRIPFRHNMQRVIIFYNHCRKINRLRIQHILHEATQNMFHNTEPRQTDHSPWSTQCWSISTSLLCELWPSTTSLAGLSELTLKYVTNCLRNPKNITALIYPLSLVNTQLPGGSCPWYSVCSLLPYGWHDTSKNCNSFPFLSWTDWVYIFFAFLANNMLPSSVHP